MSRRSPRDPEWASSGSALCGKPTSSRQSCRSGRRRLVGMRASLPPRRDQGIAALDAKRGGVDRSRLDATREMKKMTPSGTLTFERPRPLGRTLPSSTRPTGSASAATWHALPQPWHCIRSGVRLKSIDGGRLTGRIAGASLQDRAALAASRLVLTLHQGQAPRVRARRS